MDALVWGLEERLAVFQGALTELDILLSNNQREAIRSRNMMLVNSTWFLYQTVFNIDPSRSVLSYLTDLSEKTVDSILMSDEFKLGWRVVEKTGRPKDYKPVAAYQKIHLLKNLDALTSIIKTRIRDYLVYQLFFTQFFLE
jgi:hypothetical protein